VRGVPTVMIFKNGQLKSTKVGSVPESTMKAWLTENA
jgi:thioredoxin 1